MKGEHIVENQSRRDLIKSCLYLSLTGIGGYIFSLLGGCKRSERYSIVSEGLSGDKSKDNRQRVQRCSEICKRTGTYKSGYTGLVYSSVLRSAG